MQENIITPDIQEGFKFNEVTRDALLTNHQEKEITVPPHTFHNPYARREPYVRESRKIGRNEMCPCGSSMKFKKCCNLKE